MADKITSQMIREALDKKYQAPEWYLGFEVGNSTGLNCNRHADAVAINAYPSKGHETRGFEIKVSRSDLSRELENGIKSEEVAMYCDYWFLVVPAGLTKGFTLPPTWGVLEYRDGKLIQTQQATRTEKAEPSKGFLCAMLRGRERAVREAGQMAAQEREEEIRRNVCYLEGQSTQELEKLKKKLESIKSKTGIDLSEWRPTDDIIQRLNATNKINIITRNVSSLKFNAERMMEYANEILAAASDITANGAAADAGKE